MWVAEWQGISFPAITFGFLMIAVVFGCAVLVCVTDQGSNHRLCRMARWRALRSFGRYSYAIYVIHVFIKRCLRPILTVVAQRVWLPYAPTVPPVLFAVLVLVVNLGTSYLLAVVSWHLFEKHFLRLKKYFPYQIGSLASSAGEIVDVPGISEGPSSAVVS